MMVDVFSIIRLPVAAVAASMKRRLLTSARSELFETTDDGGAIIDDEAPTPAIEFEDVAVAPVDNR